MVLLNANQNDKEVNFSGIKPAVSRFAGKLGTFLPKSLPSWSRNLPAVGKNIPYLNAALGTGMGIYNLSEGQNPVDAFGRPIFQVAGGILGAGTGFFADSPFSPAADLALGYAGWDKNQLSNEIKKPLTSRPGFLII